MSATQMDPPDKGQTAMSSNLSSREMSSSERGPAQVELLPVFQSPLPVNWRPQQCSPSERILLQTGMQYTVPLNPYPLSSVDNRSVQSNQSQNDHSPSTNDRKAVSSPLLGIKSSSEVSQSPEPISPANKRPQQKALSKSQSFTATTPTNKRPTPMEQPTKMKLESFESVRLKLRESLAGALAITCDQQNKAQDMDKGTQDGSSTVSDIEMVKSDAPPTSLGDRSSSDKVVHGCLVASEAAEECDVVGSSKSDAASLEQSTCNTVACDVQEHDEATNSDLVVEDEFLQGHGLCWALECGADAEDAEALHNREEKRRKMTEKELTPSKREAIIENAENLASAIEAELFRLFGGVNKKYKEKGRSLLFNLKDRNNPELRERVLSGTISPRRLCTMTVEELASKELTEWRLAKAEELAQMVVLPDTEVDVRRLVRKTHKGEFQVEVEETDDVAAEVELGTAVQAQVQSNSNGDSDEPKASTDPSSNTDTIIQEKSDLMHELIVDEIKDPESLPPVVSLDEFMEALDSEPPFENLPADSVQDICSSGDGNARNIELEKSEANSLKEELDSPEDLNSKLKSSQLLTTNINLADNPDKLNTMDSVKDKPYSLTVSTETASSDISSSDKLWEGLVQLNLSSTATVTVAYKSGEKTSTAEWPALLEIKGRVRLDAFEKFLKELPLSRSRALMIAQFTWKEGSSESGRADLQEIYDSYISDERVGFVEPSTGVELYLCPLHPKMTDMLAKHLQKENTESLEPSPDAFVGLVVWRRPRVSSHHKHGSGKKHHSSRKQQVGSSKAAGSTVSKSEIRSILGPPPTGRAAGGGEADDVPPGFGPKEDDDLPEFDYAHNVSHASKPSSSHPLVSPSSQPVAQSRESSMHQYGLSEIVKKPLVDDDDDIPEWQPQSQTQTLPSSLPPPPPLPPTSVPQLYSQPPQNLLQLQQNLSFVPMPTLSMPTQPFMPYPYAPNQPLQMQLQPPTMMPMPIPLPPPMGMMPGGPMSLPFGFGPANMLPNNVPNMQNFGGQNLGPQVYLMPNLGPNQMYNGGWVADNSRNGGI